MSPVWLGSVGIGGAVQALIRFATLVLGMVGQGQVRAERPARHGSGREGEQRRGAARCAEMRSSRVR